MIVNNVNPNKLHEELIANGIVPLLVTHNKISGEIIAESTEIIFADNVDMTIVQAVIYAHNPEPLPPEPTEIDLLRIEQAKSNAEMIDLMMAMLGGM